MKLLLFLVILILIPTVLANESNQTEQCDFKVNILTNKTIFFDDFKFKIQVNRTYGNKSIIIITKEIIDPFGNIVKEYKNNTENILNHRTLKFSPNLKKNRAYIIKSEIFPKCNDTIKQNNFAIKEFFIVKEYEEESKIIIENIQDLGKDKKAKFGSSVRARIIIYKGNTNKKAIKVWIENEDKKITKQSKINIEEKYSEQTATIPLQIFPNCNGKLKNGTYFLKIEGLDSEDKMPIEVESIEKSNCKVIKEKIEKIILINKTKKVYINITNTETNLNLFNRSRIIYESKQEKSKRSALFFFCGILVLLVIKIKTENG